MVSAMMAAKAYAAAAGNAKPVAGAGAAGADGPDFAQLVGDAMQDAVGSSRRAETAMTQHVQGHGELLDVVTAVSSAQASLETVMAVRDQVISAYKDIMAMPI